MSGRIVVVEDPSDDDRDVIVEAVLAYNREVGPATDIRPLAILLHDANGKPVSGVYGKTSYDWLFVDFVFITAVMRGQRYGTALMREAERLATARGCQGVWLDTFSFQARGFQKLGYELFGTLNDHPRGGERYFMRKRL